MPPKMGLGSLSFLNSPVVWPQSARLIWGRSGTLQRFLRLEGLSLLRGGRGNWTSSQTSRQLTSFASPEMMRGVRTWGDGRWLCSGTGVGAQWEVIGSRGAEKSKQQGSAWTVGDEQSTSKKCDPYEQGGKPLSGEEAERLRSMQVPEWKLSEDKLSITRTWRSQDFNEAAQFLLKISILCQNEGHQPRSVGLELVRGKEEMTVTLSTPRLKGLSFADFMLALKIDMMEASWQ